MEQAPENCPASSMHGMPPARENPGSSHTAVSSVAVSIRHFFLHRFSLLLGEGIFWIFPSNALQMNMQTPLSNGIIISEMFTIYEVLEGRIKKLGRVRTE